MHESMFLVFLVSINPIVFASVTINEATSGQPGWSTYFSEENGGVGPAGPNGALIQSLRTYDGDSDNIAMLRRYIRVGTTLASFTSDPAVRTAAAKDDPNDNQFTRDTSTRNWVGCPSNSWATNMICSGASCGAVALSCNTIRFANALAVTYGTCKWTAWFREKGNTLASAVQSTTSCDPGSYMVGIGCDNNNCAWMRMRCCQPKVADCMPNYFSSTCDQCPACHPGHGTGCSDLSTGSGVCQCNEFWTGRLCEIDVNECAPTDRRQPYRCPDNSVCVNREGMAPICRCNDGFVMVEGICARAMAFGLVESAFRIGGRSMTIAWTASPLISEENSVTYTVKATEVGNTGNTVTVTGLTSTSYQFMNSRTFALKIRPFNVFEITVTPVLNIVNNVDSAGVAPQTVKFKTNCHCKEQPPALPPNNGIYQVPDEEAVPGPGTPRLQQFYSRITAYFEDTSLCEDKIAFKSSTASQWQFLEASAACDTIFRVDVEGSEGMKDLLLGSPYSYDLAYKQVLPGLDPFSPSSEGSVTIGWASRFTIKITSKSGSPISDALVTLSLTLADGAKSQYQGNTSTAGLWRADIVEPSLIRSRQSVMITIIKEVNGVKHEFKQAVTGLPLGNGRSFDVDHLSDIQWHFWDYSVITVSGTILFDPLVPQCGASRVKVTATNGEFTTTNEKGEYSLTVSSGEAFSLTASLEGHTINTSFIFPYASEVDVRVNWLDWTRRKVDVRALGGECEFNVGISRIVTSSINCSYNPEYNVDGARDLYLFPQQWSIILREFVSLADTNEADYDRNYFRGKRNVQFVDLEFHPAAVKWIYHSNPEVVVYGLRNSKPSCDENADYVVLKTKGEYPIEIEVRERYTTYPGTENEIVRVCYKVTANVSISDNIADLGDNCTGADSCRFVSEYDGNKTFASKVFYTIVPGAPNTEISPYTKKAIIHVFRPDDPSTFNATEIIAVVTGSKMYGDKYVTNVPRAAMPFLVLRRPPGSLSRAIIKKGTKFTRTIETSSGEQSLDDKQTTFSMGAAWDTGISTGEFVSYSSRVTSGEASYSTTFGGEEEKNNFKTETRSYEVSITESFSTGTDELLSGIMGDVVYLPSMLLVYSKVLVVSFNYDTCKASVYSKFTFLSVPDNGITKTSAFYSMYDILNPENGEIVRIKRMLEGEINGINRTILETELKAWHSLVDRVNRTTQTGGQRSLVLPKDLISTETVQATDLATRITFTGGGQIYSYTTELVSSEEEEIEVETVIGDITNHGFLAEMLTATTVTRSNGAYVHKFRTKLGSKKIRGKTTTVETTFELGDHSAGDRFAVDIKRDPTYATPIFTVIGGESMCPWEPGTVKREMIAYQVDRQDRTDKPTSPDAYELFEFTIKNEGDQDGVFLWGPDFATVGGLDMRLNSAPFVTTELRLNPKQITKQYVSVRLGDVKNYDYRVTTLIRSQCDPRNVRYPIDLRVKFLAPCAQVGWSREMKALADEGQPWIINRASANRMRVDIRNALYPSKPWIGDPRLTSIFLEWRYRDGVQWSTVRTTDYKAREDVHGYASYTEDFTFLADGKYCLRTFSSCKASSFAPLDTFASPILCGIVDRTPPVRFGSIEPISYIYEIGSDNVISIQFSEEIQCGLVKSLLDVKVVGNPQLKPTLLQVCDKNKLTFALSPSTPLSTVVGQQLEITVSDVKDLALNPLDAPITWILSIAKTNLQPYCVVMQNLHITLSRFPAETPVTLGQQLVADLIEALKTPLGSFEVFYPSVAAQEGGGAVFTFGLAIIPSGEGTKTASDLAFDLSLYCNNGGFTKFAFLGLLRIPDTVPMNVMTCAKPFVPPTRAVVKSTTPAIPVLEIAPVTTPPPGTPSTTPPAGTPPGAGSPPPSAGSPPPSAGTPPPPPSPPPPAGTLSSLKQQGGDTRSVVLSTTVITLIILSSCLFVTLIVVVSVCLYRTGKYQVTHLGSDRHTEMTKL